MRRVWGYVGAIGALLALLATPADAARIWGGWWRNSPATTTSTSTTTTTSTSTTSTSSTTSTTIGFTSPGTWAASFVAYWDEEEADNATALNHSGTTCGTDCNLTDSNTVARDAVTFVESTKAANFVAANNEYQSCTDATCDELDCTGTNDLTIGAWIRPADHAQNHIIFKNNSGNNAYILAATTSQTLECDLGDGTDMVSVFSGATTAADTTWAHAVCRFTDATDTLQTFINGASNGTSGTQQSCAADTSVFELSRNSAANDFNGQIDEAFVAMKALTAAQICRVCSCGIDGSYCLCDGATPTSYRVCATDADCTGGSAHGKCDATSLTCQGRNHASNPGCGGCTLPATCNASAP